MRFGKRTFSRLLLPVAIAALPAVLLISSLQTFWELDEQKSIYLRNRVGMLAGRLENLPAAESETPAFDLLSADDPNLLDLELIERGKSPGDQAFLDPIWNGRQLFRTEFLNDGRGRIYRAYVPFHSGASMKIARIDLDAGAADFLVIHARHNVIASSLGGLALVLLALYAVWAARRAAQLQVRQLEVENLAQLGRMSAMLAHEIRNPLGTIKGFAQLVGERADDALRRLLEPILSETARLESLVDNLLAYGRPPAPSERRASWEETLTPLRRHAEQLIGARAIRFVADSARLEWDTDPRLLQQALLNLIRNALEALGEEGEVRLELRRSGAAGLTLAVVDSGPGFSDEARRRLFEPFFTTKAAGTGLGLSITRRLVQSLGGELSFQPAKPAGTEALLHFPNASPRAVAG